jgi:hypothetical protein
VKQWFIPGSVTQVVVENNFVYTESEEDDNKTGTCLEKSIS